MPGAVRHGRTRGLKLVLLPASLSVCGICSERGGEVAAWWLGCDSSPHQLNAAAAASYTLTWSWDCGVAEHILVAAVILVHSSRMTFSSPLGGSASSAWLSDRALLFMILNLGFVRGSVLIRIVSLLSFDVESGCTFPFFKRPVKSA